MSKAISDIRGSQMQLLQIPFFEAQPECCRLPLEPRAVKSRSRYASVIQRIILFNPAPVYERIATTVNVRKRVQTRAEIGLHQLFPKGGDGLCGCGCGQLLSGCKTRWASPECSDFVWHVYAIIAGRRTEIKRCLQAYYGRKCACCGVAPARIPATRGRLRSGIEYDHIVPVHRGGGACWLSNYRMLCTGCHKQKTSEDRIARIAMRACS